MLAVSFLLATAIAIAIAAAVAVAFTTIETSVQSRLTVEKFSSTQRKERCSKLDT